jgi:ABC-type multidrug transport system fused ATPase/permease subunit
MVVLVLLSPKLALVALLLLPAMIWVSFRFRLNARVAYRATRASLSRMNAFLQERLSGLAVVRCSAARRLVAPLRPAQQPVLPRQHAHGAALLAVLPTGRRALAARSRWAASVWGSWLLAQGSLTSAVFVQFWMYLDFVFEPIRELAERYNVLQAAMAAAERIFGILDTPTERARGAAVRAPRARRDARAARAPRRPAVEFRDVSFAYGGGPPVLHEVSFASRRGERVAVVGHTGAGKTTLVSLLCRFYEAQQGAIRVHGRDVRSCRSTSCGGASPSCTRTCSCSATRSARQHPHGRGRA